MNTERFSPPNETMAAAWRPYIPSETLAEIGRRTKAYCAENDAAAVRYSRAVNAEKEAKEALRRAKAETKAAHAIYFASNRADPVDCAISDAWLVAKELRARDLAAGKTPLPPETMEQASARRDAWKRTKGAA